jgi:hypothetical protein
MDIKLFAHLPSKRLLMQPLVVPNEVLTQWVEQPVMEGIRCFALKRGDVTVLEIMVKQEGQVSYLQHEPAQTFVPVESWTAMAAAVASRLSGGEHEAVEVLSPLFGFLSDQRQRAS